MGATALQKVSTFETRRRFTRDEVDRLLEDGFFDGRRFELIDGDLIDKMGQLPPHAAAIRLLTRMFANAFGIERVQIQLPLEIHAGDRKWTLPEPDVVVFTPSKKQAGARFVNRHPNGSEALIVVEVADSSLRHDLEVKRAFYARAGVKEYWVLDINGRRLIVHRTPKADGTYASVRRYAEDESVGDFLVADMLPTA